jgi:hypothetical protein
MSPEAAESLIAELKTENLQLKDRLSDLTHQYEWLKRQVYGRKSERFIPSSDGQCSMPLEGVVPTQPPDPSMRRSAALVHR